MSCQNCDLPLIPGEPRCGNCGYPVPAEAAQAAPNAPVAFPSVATVYLAEPANRGTTRRRRGDDAEATRGRPDEGGGPGGAGQERGGDNSLGRNRPARFSGTASWLLSGAARNRRGIFTALIVTWSNLTFAVLLAGVGAVTGAVAGFTGSAARAYDLPETGPMLPATVAQAGGTLGTLGGAVAGALDGFVDGLIGPWWALLDGDVVATAGLLATQLLCGVLLGVGYLVMSITVEGATLRTKGARRLSRREADLITPLLNEAAEMMGIEGRPEVLILDTPAVRTFAGARHIVLSRGLLEEFNYDRAVLAAVVAHQLTHWNNADAVAAGIVRGVALPLYLAKLAATAVTTAFPHPLVRLLVWAVGWPVLALVRCVVLPAQAADQRMVEDRADQGAALAGQRDGMRRFLVRHGGPVDLGRSAWDDAACRSHPAVELRLEALEERGKGYPLPDRDAMPRPLPVEIAGTRDGAAS